jgi:ferritin-like metal-binding protein YciE
MTSKNEKRTSRIEEKEFSQSIEKHKTETNHQVT